MRRQPPISTRTDTRFPYTTLCLSKGAGGTQDGGGVGPLGDLDDPSSLSRVGAEAGRSAAAPGRRQPVARNRNDGGANGRGTGAGADRSEEHTSELQSLMRISYAVFCLKKKKQRTRKHVKTHETNKNKVNERQK